MTQLLWESCDEKGTAKREPLVRWVLPRHADHFYMPQRKGASLMTDGAGGPIVLRILLGTQLRRLREAKGITAQEAARAIRGSESKISRIELGRNAVREVDIADLLTLYGAMTRSSFPACCRPRTTPPRSSRWVTSPLRRPSGWYICARSASAGSTLAACGCGRSLTR